MNTGIQGWYGIYIYIYIYLIWIKSTQKDRKIFPKAWALSSLKCTGPGRQGSPQEGEFKRVYITKRCYPEDVHVNCMVLLCENIGRLMDKCPIIPNDTKQKMSLCLFTLPFQQTICCFDAVYFCKCSLSVSSNCNFWGLRLPVCQTVKLRTVSKRQETFSSSSVRPRRISAPCLT